MFGREKMVENIVNISKGSRSMFARQPDICFYIVNKVVKQDLKMTKIWIPKVSDKRDDIDYGS